MVHARCYEWAYFDDGPVGDPDANLRLYGFLKEKTQRSSHFMIRINIYDNPQWRSGPLPTVDSDLPSTYQLIPPFIAID